MIKLRVSLASAFIFQRRGAETKKTRSLIFPYRNSEKKIGIQPTKWAESLLSIVLYGFGREYA